MKKYLMILAGILVYGAKAEAQPLPLPVVIPSIITVSSFTAASGTTATVTISSPVATTYSTGLNTYVTNVHIEMYPTATLVGAAGPVKCTSTNLNSVAWSFNTNISSGTVQVMDMQFANPIIAPNAAINTVVSCPGTTSIIWNVIVGYFQAS